MEANPLILHHSTHNHRQLKHPAEAASPRQAFTGLSDWASGMQGCWVYAESLSLLVVKQLPLSSSLALTHSLACSLHRALFYLLREKLPESLNQLFEILWRGASKQNPLDFLWLLSLFYTWALLWLRHKSFLTLRDRGTYLAYQNLAYQ